MNSIRARLNLGILVVLALVFVGGGWAVIRSLRAGMEREVERSLYAFLRSEAGPILRDLLPPLGPPPRGARFDEGESRRPLFGRPDGPLGREPLRDPAQRTDFVYQVWRDTSSRRSLILETELPRVAAELEVVDFEALRPGVGTCLDLVLELQGERLPARALAVRFRAPERPGSPRERPLAPVLELVVARPTREVEQTLAATRRVLLLAGVIGLAAASLLLLGVVRRGLRPLEDLRTALADLDTTQLGAGLGLADPVRELQPVVAQLEALLRRVQGEMRREQSFSADAAHELRTPLAGIRATLEVLLARQREPEAYERGARESLAIARQMQALVERLLVFARERGTARLEVAELDVSEALERAWGAFSERARERGLRLEAALERPAPLRTDPRLLERVLSNLVENAVCHADADGTVEATLRREAGGIRLLLSNAARAATPETAERAFDAFWRADPARAAVGEHAGLGLSLCQRVVEELGGHVRARVEEGRFTIELELPDLEPPAAA